MAMDRSLHITVGGLYAGLVIGFGVGWLYAEFRRGWRTLTAAKTVADVARKNAWGRSGDLLVLGFLLAVAAALMMGNIGGR